MFDIPFYTAEEYLYNNQVYKGKYPIAIVENECEVPIFKPKTTLLEELGETDLGISGMVILSNEDSNIANPLYIYTETDDKIKEEDLEKSFFLSEL